MPDSRDEPSQPCRYIVQGGRRYFIPGCYGALHGVGMAGCTCRRGGTYRGKPVDALTRAEAIDALRSLGHLYERLLVEREPPADDDVANPPTR